jgi:ubiquitin C-terminal hydrolase
LVSALRALFLYISKHPEDKGVVAPRAFIDKLKEVNELFRSTMHQDAHEFLNYLLNKVVEEIEGERRQQPATPPLPPPPPPAPVPAEDREYGLP